MPALDLATSDTDPRPVAFTAVRLAAAPLVLALGTAATLILIVLAQADPAGAGSMLELGHWTLAAITAVIVAGLAARGTSGMMRRVRLGAGAALAMWALGVAAWVLMVAMDTASVPSVADAFSLAFVIPGAWTLWVSVHGRLRGADELALYLDVGLVLIATITLVVAATGADAHTLGGTAGILAIVYPSLFIGAGLASLVAVVALGQRLVPSGSIAFGLGAMLTGLAWFGWVLPAAAGMASDRTLGALFSIGPLVCAYGAMTWSGAPETRPGALLIARLVRWSVGPAAVTLVAVIAWVWHDHDPVVEWLLHGLLIAAATLLFARFAFHVRERGEMVRDLAQAHVENEQLIERLQAELEERERAQQRLIDASRMSAVGELAAAVAHEVNNPLTSVLGYADLLLATGSPDAAHRSDLEVIRSEALRVRDRVRALLDFATPRRGDLVESDLATVVAAPLDLLRYHLDRRGISIDVRAEPMDQVELDPTAIQQVLVNLISVMAAALPDGGRIGIVTRPDAERAAILVELDRTDVEAGVIAGWLMPFEDVAAGLGIDVRRHGIAATVGVLRGHGGTISARRSPSGRPQVEITLPFGQRDGGPGDG